MKHFQHDVVTKSGRAKLPERREPYWAPLSEGAGLGYRQKAGGSWIARWRDRSGQLHYQALGAHADFNAAREAATTWVTQMSAGSRRRPARGSLRDGLAVY